MTGTCLRVVWEAAVGLYRSWQLTAGATSSRNQLHSFIPTRDGLDVQTSFQLMQSDTTSTSPSKGKRKAAVTDNDAQKGASCSPRRTRLDNGGTTCSRLHLLCTDDANKTFNALLKTELFGPDSLDPSANSSLRTGSPSRNNSSSAQPSSPSSPSSSKKVFSFTSPSRKFTTRLDSPTHERYSVSPVKYESQRLLLSPKKQQRQLSRVPFKVLDAPELAVRSLSSLRPTSYTRCEADFALSCLRRMTIT